MLLFDKTLPGRRMNRRSKTTNGFQNFVTFFKTNTIYANKSNKNLGLGYVLSSFKTYLVTVAPHEKFFADTLDCSGTATHVLFFLSLTDSL